MHGMLVFFASRKLLRDRVAFDAPQCCLAYFMHGAVLSPERAEELCLKEIDDLASRQQTDLGRWRTA